MCILNKKFLQISTVQYSPFYHSELAGTSCCSWPDVPFPDTPLSHDLASPEKKNFKKSDNLLSSFFGLCSESIYLMVEVTIYVCNANFSDIF